MAASGDDVEYKLDQLIGNGFDSVPFIQVVGPYTCGKTDTVLKYLDRRGLSHAYLDLSTHQHCGSGNVLLDYEWNRFKNRLLDDLGLEDRELRSFALEGGTRLTGFTKLLFSKLNAHRTDVRPKKKAREVEGRLVVYVFDNYTDLVNHDNKLLVNIIKLHEYIHNFDTDVDVPGLELKQELGGDRSPETMKGPKLKTRLLVILIGLYEVPINFQFNLPLPKIHMMPSKTKDGAIDYIVERSDIDPGFVKYTVQILFKYYNNDIKSLFLYTSFLWNLLSDRKDDRELQEVLDKYLYNIILNFKTRQLDCLFTTPGQEPKVKNMVKNTLSKVIILSAYIASKYTIQPQTQYYKRYIGNPKSEAPAQGRNRDRRSVKEQAEKTDIRKLAVNLKKKEESARRRKKRNMEEDKEGKSFRANSLSDRGEFTLKYWLAVTQLLLILISFGDVSTQDVYRHVLWVIEEGYVHVISNNRNSLVIGKSGLLFLDSVTSQAKSSPFNLGNLCLLNGNLKFCLNVSREFVDDIERELDFNAHLLFNMS